MSIVLQSSIEKSSIFLLYLELWSAFEAVLHPQHFFRLNRSFITQFDSIDRIINLSKSRMKIELKPQTKREIIVSSANSRSFKEWLNR